MTADPQPNDFAVVSAANEVFASALAHFEANINKMLGVVPHIGDLGLSLATRNVISRPYDFQHDTGDISVKNSKGNVRATHKASLIAAMLGDGYGTVLYLDADTVVTERFDLEVFSDCDLYLTPRHPRELRRDSAKANGLLNSGVIFFRNNERTRKVVEEWIEASKTPSTTDQLALSHIVEKILTNESYAEQLGNPKIGFLNPLLYNDTALKTGAIFHVKNFARHPRQRQKLRIISRITRLTPALMTIYVKYQRRKEEPLNAVVTREDFLQPTPVTQQDT